MDITFSCVNCGQSLTADESGAGISIDCPNCGKPVYVPSRATQSPVEPVRIAVKPVRPIARADHPATHSNPIPPSVEGGLHCLVIATVLAVAGLVLFRMGSVAGMVCYAAGIPFQVGAMLCAIYGICHGPIKHGLALLAGVSALCVLVMVGPLWFQMRMITTMSPMMEDAQKQMEQMLKPPQR
jgi:hypothetical protein